MSDSDSLPHDLLAPTPEHAQLGVSLREFVRREVEPQAAEFDRKEEFNHGLFKKAGELGLLGITLPEELGGSEMDAVAAVQVYEALSTSDPGFALAVLAHAILFAQNVNVNGNEQQRKHVLPKAATGEWVGGLCMTEPAVGTDVLSLRTKALRDGDEYVITGTKTFITNGGIDDQTLGDAFVVYATTGERQISSFLVEKGTPGFRLGQKWADKLGMRSSFTAELVFEEVRVPVSSRLGEEGEGTLQMMRNLEVERLTLAAMSLGIAQRSLQVMIGYANERTSFGSPIRDHGQIQRYIAENYAAWISARTFVYDTARKIDLGSSGQRMAADAAKLVASQMAKAAADAAVQVLGGYGYMGEYVVERLWRDAKLLEIGGGTLEAHHKNLTKDLCRNPGVLS